MKKEVVESLFSEAIKDKALKSIAEKVLGKERINDEEALLLFENR